MEPLDLFKGERDESMEKINQTVHALDAYSNAYAQYKGNLKNYFKNGEVVKEFDFTPKLVFAKWDMFMERVRIIQDLFHTAAEFLRLEKVEIGGKILFCESIECLFFFSQVSKAKHLVHL